MKAVACVLSVVFYFFGILFVWGAFGDPFDGSALVIGLITLAVASVILWLATRKKAGSAERQVTYKVDLGGKVNMDQLTCSHCGGPIGVENITMVAGAPTVTCPYCGVSYQITEEPKW